MIEGVGRGAWPRSGTGGTLNASTGNRSTIPGPYYMYAFDDPSKMVGLEAYRARQNGLPGLNFSSLAVWHGVVGIQMLANFETGIKIEADGVFGRQTARVVRIAQSHLGIEPDGVVGPQTMRALLVKPVRERAGITGVPWEPVMGILRNEGGFDPGAVGVLDPSDLGLAQINIPSHPHVSVSDAFCPSFAVRFVCEYLKFSLDSLNGNILDAVASYNLGIGGTRQWIAAGRPDVWTPTWSTTQRKVKAYIDRIMKG